MSKPKRNEEQANLERMSAIIAQLEQLLIALKEAGGKMPFIEKNVTSMMSFIYVLKFGVSDMAEAAKKD